MDQSQPKTPLALIPPLRFSTIHPNIHRGSYPRKENYRFLRRYKIKTIISLTPNPITRDTDAPLLEFLQKENIKLIHIEVGKGGKGKKRRVPLTHDMVIGVIEAMIDANNGPVYMHCLNGCHVTSLVVACFRCLLMWTKASIFSEFISYSDTINVADRTFVDSFEGGELLNNQYFDRLQ
ncbi:protein-tyrosine-phosphatase [Saccharomycopsis crataegensis]|uniref:Protein-tyrosine-phosphatase n=1 Tax=Saccharomycopsis crataegensis TaxID=43959 RepID=A0AAV5QHN0_9ASCO|nr:protein-tyrosine-phosphatase [Saccharomycopsis crataegensis]